MNDPSFPGGAYPAGGFLQYSIDYASPLTEAVPQFHLGSALTTLSIVIDRKVSIQWGDKLIYPNLYLCLIGKSSISRKSTSANIQKGVLRTFNKDLILPEQYSNEKLVADLSNQPIGIFYIDEFGGFLQNCTKSYLAGTIELLTELYDCPPMFIRKLRKESFEVENPYLSILATSTLTWLEKNIKEGNIQGGFFPRFLFFISDKVRDPIPIPPPPNRELKEKMIQELRIINLIQGKAILSEQARARYMAWYIQNFIALQNEDQNLTSAYTRLSDYCIKIAILYEISATHCLEISEDTMKRTIKLIDYLKDTLKRMLINDIAFTPYDKQSKKILDRIKSKPGINKTELFSIVKDSQTLNRILANLQESEQITQGEGPKAENNKKPFLYFPKEAISKGSNLREIST